MHTNLSHSSHPIETVSRIFWRIYLALVPIIRSRWLDMVMSLFVVINAIMMGVEIELGRIDDDVSKRVPWFVVQNVISFAFCVELVYRIRREGSRFWFKPWNSIDFILICMSATSTWILSFVSPSTGAQLQSLYVASRLLRILTVPRLIGIFASSRGLSLLISGFMDAIKTIFWVAIIVIFMLYACAVFLTITIGQDHSTYEPYKLLSGGWDYQEFFGSVPRSIFTLFQIITLDDWANGVARHVMTNQPAMAIFFIIFIFITAYGILNVIVGIIVERTLASAKLNEEKNQRNQEKERTRVLHDLRDIFEYADKDKSGTLTIDEFRNALRQPEVERKLKLIDLPVSDAEELFNVLDGDGSGELSVEEFIGGCIRLKGPARSKDLLAVQICIESLSEKLETIEEVLDDSEKSMDVIEQKVLHILHAAQKISKKPRYVSREPQHTRHDSPNQENMYAHRSRFRTVEKLTESLVHVV